MRSKTHPGAPRKRQERNLKSSSPSAQGFQERSRKDAEPAPAAGGDPPVRSFQEKQIQQAVEWFTSYLCSERDRYYGSAQPLSGPMREAMDGYFDAALLDEVRVAELTERRVANPWFYPAARAEGVRHLPDITHKTEVTFLDVVVFNEKINSRDLFHGLVHAAQVKVLGLDVFADLFVRGFLRARSYFLVPLKAQAFGLDARFAANREERFSVEGEIRRWRRERRY